MNKLRIDTKGLLCQIGIHSGELRYRILDEPAEKKLSHMHLPIVSSEGRGFIIPNPVMNPYDPQTLNRYAYVKNNPYTYNDPTGEYAQYAIPGIIGFVGGSVAYMMTHDGSGWGHVGKTYAAGAIGAGTAMATVAFLTTPGGQAVAAKGLEGGLSLTGAGLTGVAGNLATQALDGGDTNMVEAAISGVTNIPGYGFGLRPGSFVGTANMITKNNLKLGAQEISGQAMSQTVNYLYEQLFETDNQQQTPANSGQSTANYQYSSPTSNYYNSIFESYCTSCSEEQEPIQ